MLTIYHVESLWSNEGANPTFTCMTYLLKYQEVTFVDLKYFLESQVIIASLCAFLRHICTIYAHYVSCIVSVVTWRQTFDFHIHDVPLTIPGSYICWLKILFRHHISDFVVSSRPDAPYIRVSYRIPTIVGIRWSDGGAKPTSTYITYLLQYQEVTFVDLQYFSESQVIITSL